MVRCELCGKNVLDKAGVFTEWKRTSKARGFAKIRGTTLGNYEPSRDRRKAHVYCHKCRKRISQVLDAVWFY
jgi:hypothetical protein